MQLAHQLIESLSDEWDPTEYKDTYTDVLKKVIRQKAEGKEIVVPQAEQQPARVVDLMHALRASLTKKALTKVPARKPAARRSRTSGKAA
jgi:DNA end-binding protein Ku